MTDEHRQDTAHVFRGADGLFYWTVHAPNGEAIAQSEGYHNRGDAETVLRDHFPTVGIVEDDA